MAGHIRPPADNESIFARIARKMRRNRIMADTVTISRELFSELHESCEVQGYCLTGNGTDMDMMCPHLGECYNTAHPDGEPMTKEDKNHANQ
jgi:hypothetical protein